MPLGRAVRSTAALALTALVLAAVDHAAAQPFGLTHAAPFPPGGPAGWILAEQAQFYRMLSDLIRAAKADGSAGYALLGISFVYGVFHAAGPGHGKAVISSYLVANNETWRRGLVLSFAAAVLQSLTAIAIVGIAAALIGATARAMGKTVRVVEIASYALIVLIGLRLVWVKGRAMLRLVRDARLARGGRGDPAGHRRERHGDHAHPHGEDEASACGHVHAPEPRALAGRHWLKRGLAAVAAVGLRPCSGAIIVLVFSLAQGLFLIGVASTFVMGIGAAMTVAAVAVLAVGARGFAARLAGRRPGAGTLLLHGLEIAAAFAIVLFGLALLTGYMASERMGLF